MYLCDFQVGLVVVCYRFACFCLLVAGLIIVVLVFDFVVWWLFW